MLNFYGRSVLINMSLVMIVAILGLQACGAGAEVEPKSRLTVTPISATPQVNTTPTEPDNPPTSVVPNQAEPALYTHPSNQFSIRHPNRWEPFERSDGAIFIEPGDRAGYSVIFNDVGVVYSDQDLNQYLVTFVAQNFAGKGSGFKAISQEQLPDGLVVAQFASNEPDLGRTISEVRVFQRGSIVFVLHFSATAAQWESSRAKLQALIESFTALETGSAVANESPDSEPPEWELIGPDGKQFSFFFADNWVVAERDGNSVTVTDPTGGLVFSASSFAWPRAATDPKAAEKAALEHLAELSEEVEQVEHLPPAEFPLDSSTGATIDYFYQTSDGKNVAGSVITAVHEGKMYKIVFTAPAEPAEDYDLALQWFNPMYRSFRFLSPADVVVDEP